MVAPVVLKVASVLLMVASVVLLGGSVILLVASVLLSVESVVLVVASKDFEILKKYLLRIFLLMILVNSKFAPTYEIFWVKTLSVSKLR